MFLTQIPWGWDKYERNWDKFDNLSPFSFVTLQANSDIKYSFIIMSEILKATGEIVMYQPDETIRLEVRMDEDTVWLTQAQMAELFATGRQAITKHLQNIYESSELSKEATSSILEQVRQEGNRKVRNTRDRRVFHSFFSSDTIDKVGRFPVRIIESSTKSLARALRFHGRRTRLHHQLRHQVSHGWRTEW